MTQPSRLPARRRPQVPYRLRLLGALGLSVLCLPLLALDAGGQEPEDLPPARELIDRYVHAIGGREAHASPASIRSSGVLRMPAMGVEGEFELLQIPSVGSRLHTVLPGVGEMRVGFDGEVGWSVNDRTGPSLMEGDELRQIQERSLLEAALRSPEVIQDAETVELTEFDGRECFRVRLSWVSGRETHDCYAADSGILVASQESQVGPMGQVPVLTLYQDYREFHGMNLPTRLVQTTMGLEQVMEIREVVVNDGSTEDLEPPAEIRVLLDDDPPGGP
jgi:zinc protease